MTDPAPESDEPSADAIPFVVVETDPSREGYDPRLASWLSRLRRAPGVPFSRRHRLSARQLRERYREVEVGAAGGGVRLRVPSAARAAEGRGPDERLAFELVDARARLAVEAPAGPADRDWSAWLEHELASRGLQVRSSRPFVVGGCVMADVLAGRGEGRDERVGRWITVPRGGEVLLVSVEAPRGRYPDVAADVLVARDALLDG